MRNKILNGWIYMMKFPVKFCGPLISQAKACSRGDSTGTGTRPSCLRRHNVPEYKASTNQTLLPYLFWTPSIRRCCRLIGVTYQPVIPTKAQRAWVLGIHINLSYQRMNEVNEGSSIHTSNILLPYKARQFTSAVITKVIYPLSDWLFWRFFLSLKSGWLCWPSGN